MKIFNKECDNKCGTCSISSSICDSCAISTPARDPSNSCACIYGYIDGPEGSCESIKL